MKSSTSNWQFAGTLYKIEENHRELASGRKKQGGHFGLFRGVTNLAEWEINRFRLLARWDKCRPYQLPRSQFLSRYLRSFEGGLLLGRGGDLRLTRVNKHGG